MNLERALSLLGIAQRSGNVISGSDTLIKTLRNGDGELLIIAADCARNNREKLVHLAEREQIDYCFTATATELGDAIGKNRRVAVLIMDRGWQGPFVNDWTSKEELYAEISSLGISKTI